MSGTREEERRKLADIINHWNANRLDLFEISQPTEVGAAEAAAPPDTDVHVTFPKTRNNENICAFESGRRRDHPYDHVIAADRAEPSVGVSV
uniref:Afadin n=1 Tax=Oryzias melastigma TaxID=30732 RepID=A0A3B3DQL8_ORYME